MNINRVLLIGLTLVGGYFAWKWWKNKSKNDNSVKTVVPEKTTDVPVVENASNNNETFGSEFDGDWQSL